MPRNFQNVHRIVVKIGTSSLTHESGKLNLHRIDRLSRDLCDLKNQGKEVLLVSSGAIAAGVSRLHLPQKEPLDDNNHKNNPRKVGLGPRV